jgi:hypothetical protein
MRLLSHIEEEIRRCNFGWRSALKTFDLYILITPERFIKIPPETAQDSKSLTAYLARRHWPPDRHSLRNASFFISRWSGQRDN